MFSLLRQGRYLRLFAIGLLVAVGCCAAGVWQYHRWHGKRDANAELRANAAAGPVPVDQLMTADRPFDPANRMRQLQAVGSYQAADELYVRQRQVNDEVGFLVVTPLRTTDGPMLLVVRGWLPAEGSATQTPTAPAPPAGQVRLVARGYPGEPGGLGVGLPAGQIQRINVAAIGARLGAPVYLGYAELISTEPVGGGAANAQPAGEQPASALPVLPPPDLSNPAGGADEWQHLAYVVQWFCFALLALAAPVLLAHFERRELATARARPVSGGDVPAPV